MNYKQPPLYVSPHRSVPSSAVPLVQTMDAQHGPWTNNPNYGANIPFSADANNRQKILKLDEWGPPSEWTLSLGMYYDESNAANDISFRIIADVTIGAGGATQTFQVDITRGVKIASTMNAIDVVVQYVPDFAIPAALKVPTDLRVTALLSRGCRAGNYPPTLSFPVTQLAGGGTHTAPLPIPNFARAVWVLPVQINAVVPVIDPYISTVQLDLVANKNLDAVVEMPLSHILSFANGFPVPAESKYWILNNDSANIVSVIVVFALAL